MASNTSHAARTTRLKQLRALLAERIIVTDGAMGTMIQKARLHEDDFRGEIFPDHPGSLQGNNDLLNLTRPALIQDLHDGYLRAGADIITTNTFNSTAISQGDYGLADRAYEISYAGARLARAAADAYGCSPRFVAGSLGPTPRTASLSPDVNDPAARSVVFDELADAYGEAARGLIDGGADIVLIETIFDTLNAKAAIYRLLKQEPDIPIMILGTISDAAGRILSGQTIQAFYYSVAHARPLAVGLNCGLGAAELQPYVREMARFLAAPLIVYPNAGLPNAFGAYDQSPQDMAQFLGAWAQEGLVNIVGGCCGSTFEHIKAIADAVRGHRPRPIPQAAGGLTLSGLEAFTV